jgi:hypothetical protein
MQTCKGGKDNQLSNGVQIGVDNFDREISGRQKDHVLVARVRYAWSKSSELNLISCDKYIAMSVKRKYVELLRATTRFTAVKRESFPRQVTESWKERKHMNYIIRYCVNGYERLTIVGLTCGLSIENILDVVGRNAYGDFVARNKKQTKVGQTVHCDVDGRQTTFRRRSQKTWIRRKRGERG